MDRSILQLVIKNGVLVCHFVYAKRQSLCSYSKTANAHCCATNTLFDVSSLGRHGRPDARYRWNTMSGPQQPEEEGAPKPLVRFSCYAQHYAFERCAG
jgi:hypothetical protein